MSNKSIWLGPPSMNSKMQALARGAALPLASAASKDGREQAPNPKPPICKKRRRGS
jgi:hypothetical protein